MGVRLSDAWLDELRSRLNIADVIGDYVQLRQKGRRYWGLCPFHNEKTPSFSVDADAQMFYCFGCHKGGNVIHFVMEMERMEFMDAVRLLSERAHFPMPAEGARVGGVSRELKDRLYAANLAAARYYHEMIWTEGGAPALQYLHKRGLDDRDIKKFGLGATGDGWEGLTRALGAEGFTDEELVAAGLTVKREERRYDMFRERVMFPILNAQGQVLGFGGRAMGDANPKYLNTADTPVFNKRLGLYAMNFVRKERGLKALILVEGYMDVVSLRRVGIEGVVATLGTALTEEQARLIKRYAPTVLLAYDGDGAGQKAIARALDIFEAQQHPARVVVFPDGQDPDDFVKAKGAAGFDELKRLDPFEYRMLRAREDLDLSNQEGRTQYAMRCCDILKKVANPVELENYVARLIIDTGFPRETLLSQIGVQVQKSGNEEEKRLRSGHRKAEAWEGSKEERAILFLLSQKLIPPESVAPSDFDTPLYRQMAQMLLEGESPASVMDHLPDDKREEGARALSDEAPPSAQNALKVLEDSLRGIRMKRLDGEINRLQTEARSADEARRGDLMRRIQELLKEKISL